jgi:hypothetical protein
LPAASAYNFDSNIGCWITNNQLTNTVLQWASGPVGSTSGGGALQAAVSYSASTQLTEELELPLPAGTDLTGKLLSMNLYIDNSVKGTAWGGGIQTYIKYGSSTTFCNKSWVNISGFGDWYPYTMDLSTLCTAGVTDVRAIGIQVIVRQRRQYGLYVPGRRHDPVTQDEKARPSLGGAGFFYGCISLSSKTFV